MSMLFWTSVFAIVIGVVGLVALYADYQWTPRHRGFWHFLKGYLKDPPKPKPDKWKVTLKEDQDDCLETIDKLVADKWVTYAARAKAVQESAKEQDEELTSAQCTGKAEWSRIYADALRGAGEDAGPANERAAAWDERAKEAKAKEDRAVFDKITKAEQDPSVADNFRAAISNDLTLQDCTWGQPSTMTNDVGSRSQKTGLDYSKFFLPHS